MLALILIGAILASGAFVPCAYHGISADTIEQTIRSWSAWGVLASIGLMVLHSFVPFPAVLFAIANGMIFGPFWSAARQDIH